MICPQKCFKSWCRIRSPWFPGALPIPWTGQKPPQGDHWLQHCWQRCRNAFFGSGEADQKSHSYGIDGPFTDALPMMTFRSFHRFLHGGAPKPHVWWFIEPNTYSSTYTHTYIYICTTKNAESFVMMSLHLLKKNRRESGNGHGWQKKNISYWMGWRKMLMQTWGSRF